MAERGVYLTNTTYVKPTIFEIVAQQSLSLTLEQIFNKFYSFLITNNPEKYGCLDRWSHEVYLLFNGVIQYFYLKNYSASFAETFYGLKRVTIINSHVENEISRNKKILHLITLIINPYIKSKFQQHELEIIDGKIPKEKWKQLMKIYFVKTYKIINFTYNIIETYYYLRYLIDDFKNPTPLFHLLSSTLTYSDPFKVTSMAELFNKWKQNNFSTSEGVELIQRGFMTTLELGAFFLQFVSWWNQENYYTNITSLPTPPSPPTLEMPEKSKGLCPVCCKTLNIPTAVAVSGYVFCYQCILPIIQTDKRCPVTLYPAKEDDLIRIYMNK
ncbi:peroxisome assembly protein 12-A [Microplitis demolitor]|uniref:peroxisome assembly protein 12-A n=1 Tax=Microplitis demolitor TaxID=69319 RepID=UPI0004CD7761|nr:peroxisome assembly protein 12-A [Microplitis demolitor]